MEETSHSQQVHDSIIFKIYSELFLFPYQFYVYWLAKSIRRLFLCLSMNDRFHAATDMCVPL